MGSEEGYSTLRRLGFLLVLGHSDDRGRPTLAKVG